MAQRNLALNSPTSVSSFVQPYESARAANGTYGQEAPTSRWLCNSLPGWMAVDLGVNSISTSYWINRWVVRHMSVAGWETPDYNMSDYKLQGSNDNTKWVDIDSVSDNTEGITDRTFTPVSYRFVRLYVTKGLNCNPRMASAMELEVYEYLLLSPYLKGLTISNGALIPAFVNNMFDYTAHNVANSVPSVTVTPTAEDSKATIKVKGNVVTSGSASGPINLNVGVNIIEVEVTAADGLSTRKYIVTVIREAALPGSSLTAISAETVVGTTNTPITLIPSAFDPNIFLYTGTIEYSDPNFSIQDLAVTPTANADMVIKYLGAATPSGTPMTFNNPPAGDTDFVFEVFASDGTSVNYTVRITRKHSTYLKSVISTPSTSTVIVTKIHLSYSLKTGAASATITPTAEDPDTVIEVEMSGAWNPLIPGSPSPSIVVLSGPTGAYVPVRVRSNSGIPLTSYMINLKR